MKIPSHTGNLVEARHLMRVSYKDGTTHGTFTIHSINNKYIFDLTGQPYPPERCTMLHCPFQVGDEVELCDIGFMETYWDKHIFNATDAAIISLSGEYKGVPYGRLYRHSNPDLRDAPGYQKQVAI